MGAWVAEGQAHVASHNTLLPHSFVFSFALAMYAVPTSDVRFDTNIGNLDGAETCLTDGLISSATTRASSLHPLAPRVKKKRQTGLSATYFHRPRFRARA